ncbi:tagaturonate reductase [Rhizosphaericola mali]|uniref:Tagaturonate reductase n=1 Tax=Rhizosphaericola mali TaxID=2545455 RepID=A0A5P2G3V2_9BACT|nr:tagaturonate reductase [Rhizosphaericola mali]QES88809.1 tagaturonate reductase [Rhizosphaericola mali]
MQLNIENIDSLKNAHVILPTKESFQYPEKVLQFGTGVLLRGLPDYYINKANQSGFFKGRIVVVKSTNSGGADAFSEQDSLYSVCVRGTVDGTLVEEDIINNSISRVINANTEWNKILETASNKDLRIIISNTTEVGIVDSDDKIMDAPPASFPGKILAILYKRFEVSPENGFVILPTELISNNGETLKKIVVNLAKKNNLGSEFVDWIITRNHFCNTLVDRIVPGAYNNENLSYDDKLMIMAEPFGLWAIESKEEEVKQILEFATIDKGIVITPSIEKFKEIKLRLLNGSHTLTCALSILSGFETVKQSMQNETFYQLVKTLLLEEIGPAIQSDTISENDITNFSNSILDRFSNPFLEHKWLSIATNYTEKFKLRCIPILDKWYNKYQSIPQFFSLGLAAYLQLLSSDIDISDKSQNTIRELWKSSSNPINAILKETSFWGQDLTIYDGLEEKLAFYLDKNLQKNAIQYMSAILKNTNISDEK